MRIPISIKLIVITVALLLGVTVPIAFKSSEYFENVSKQREETVNLDYAAAKSIEVDNIIKNSIDKSKMLALSFFSSLQANNNSNTEAELNFKADPSLISIEVLEIKGLSTLTLLRKIKKDENEKYKFKDADIDSIRKKELLNIKEISSGQVQIVNGSFPKSPPIFSIAFPLLKDDNGQTTHIVIADLFLSLIQKPFTERNARTLFVLDSIGNVLAFADPTGPDDSKATSRFNMSQHTLFQSSQNSFMPKGQKTFYDDVSGIKQKYIGAYSKTSYGLTVYSQIDESTVLEPAYAVKRQAFFIAGLVLSGSIFLVFLFSISLTSPLETLADLIQKVSEGNFNVKAKKSIHSFFKDEVEELAIAFDQMTEGLKERDKVKTLFSKFHGSSVTEDLMKGDIGLGGQNKNVVVFFSDIRGFTAFSEKRSPEEVVAMLNEYFGVMVSVINKNQGVVDKFIGDAIMAVWGAPKSSNHDAHNAVKACLEMRVALADLNHKRIQKGQPPIHIGMGLHAGRAISGTIGSNERMEYTIIGNTVNTGSRIEASTKAFGSDLLISDDVINQLDDEFFVEYAGSAEVKGRSEPLKLYKVKGYKNSNGKYVEVKTEYSDYTAEHADKVKIA